MCVSKFVRMSNQLSSIAIIFFFNNAAFREDNFESLTLFNFFSPLNLSSRPRV